MYSLTVALLALGSCLAVSACGCDYSANLPSYGQGVIEAPCAGSPVEIGISSGSLCSAYPSGVQIEAPACSPISVGSSYLESSAPVISSYGAESNYPSYNVAQQTLVQGPSYLELSNDAGPQPKLEPIKYLPTYSLPVQQLPLKVIEAGPLPAPVVIANKCVCTKVVQKPQLYQRIIVQQKNQRFLKKTYVPRTEKVAYCAKPRC